MAQQGTARFLSTFALMVVLAALSIACSLSAQPPTPPPSQTPFIIIATQPPATNTTAPTNIPAPTSTPNLGGAGNIPCTGAPASWISYIVQPGDTLGILAQRTGATLAQLTTANCVSNPNLLAVGQVIRLPRQPIPPTITPIPQPVIRWGGTPPNLLCHVLPVIANAPIYSDAGLVSFRAFLGDWAPWVETLGSTYRIQLPDGTTGWMHTATVRLGGNCGIVPPTLPPTWTSTPTTIPFPSETSTSNP